MSTTSGFHHSHPNKIGPWKLGRTLGRGATGRVLLGVHQQTGQKAAVKVVSKSELNEEYEAPSDKKDGLPYGIEREIIIMKLLTHPNVLRLYDVWETSKALYLVLEYVEGGELFDLLVERGPLHEQEAVKYFRQIVLGTAYCHALGICHRDLKPENLLLDASLNVKLADFGMAALESNGKLLETSCGSPHYAAPEIVSGLKYHGAASDVWSCGVILFALLTGRLPFDDENIRNLLLKVQAGTFEMPEDISPEAQDLIWQMLTVDPMKRLTTSDVLSHELLNKYPIPNEDLISVKSLPHPETAYKSLGSAKNIDKQILQNLLILWHNRAEDDIVRCLLTEGSNPEKTFYALLLRYRHSHDESHVPGSSPSKRIPRSTSQLSNRASQTPKKRQQQIALTSKNRPLSYQRRYSQRNANRMSAASSVANSPYKSPHRSPRRARGTSSSPSKSPRKRTSYQAGSEMLPRNVYNEIIAAEQNPNSMPSLPPTLPSKDSIYADEKRAAAEKETLNALAAAPKLTLGPTAPSSKRLSMMSRSNSRMSKRKSFRQSMSTGLKRNSITVKLLSTYAKLSTETDWEYMDKLTKRTSATFATLCDKIFNHQEYDEDEEKLEDDEERKAREYEKLMENERKKRDAELRARRELAKQKKRSKRRSLWSTKKLNITVHEDTEGAENNSDNEGKSEQELVQPKRTSKQINMRSISEGAAEADLTKDELETIKRRSVTQPQPKRRLTPILTRRPVSRLDPLWIAFDNEKISRAQDALEEETEDFAKQRKKANRESMVSVGYADEDRLSKNLDYESTHFKLPEHERENHDLSTEYMSEIRKSRLLNSQYNIPKLAEDQPKRTSTVSRKSNSEQRQTLISSVHIPKVARKLSQFTSSNKRLSLLTIKSTKESYQDLNSFLDTHNENVDADDLEEEEKIGRGMPNLRTSFADRLDRAESYQINEEDEDVGDAASVMDFDEHLAKKRSSYYAGGPASRRKSTHGPVHSNAVPTDDDKPLNGHGRVNNNDADYTFADEDEQPRKSSDTGDVFDKIKLPDGKNVTNAAKHRVSAHQPAPSSMLIPNLKELAKAPQTLARTTGPKQYGGMPKHVTESKKPLEESTNVDAADTQGGKRSRLIFRKLSWGSKKALENPKQLPSPADLRSPSSDEKRSGFMRWFTSSSTSAPTVKRYKTVLPKLEMMAALYSLLNSWTTFGLKNLKKDMVGYNITGAISSDNSFNIKSCKFRIKINARAMNKSELICAYVKGSRKTADTLFGEIQRVLEKEGALDV